MYGVEKGRGGKEEVSLWSDTDVQGCENRRVRQAKKRTGGGGRSVHAQSAPRHGAVGPASQRRCSRSSAWTRAPSPRAGCTKGRALCWPLASLLSLPSLAGRRPSTRCGLGGGLGPAEVPGHLQAAVPPLHPEITLPNSAFGLLLSTVFA